MRISHVNFFFNVFEVVLLWVVLVDVRAIAISCISRFASRFY